MLSLSIKAFMRLLLSYCKIVCFTIAFIIFCLNIKCVVADVHEVSDKDLMKVFSNKDIYFSKNKKLTFIKSSVLQKHINHHTTISNAFNLNFSKINIINLVSKISKIMNKNFIISGLDNLSKHVSIIVTAMPLTFVQVWNVFQSALCANSLSLVKVGDFYKITSILHVKTRTEIE